MGIDYETTAEIEQRIGWFFKPRANIIVPRVSWGFGIHECDLLVMHSSGYCTEVEIKTSRVDLIKDAQKRHGHKSDKIRRLFFAIPQRLCTCDIVRHLPDRAGLIVVDAGGRCRIVRRATPNILASRLPESEKTRLLRLAYLRYWDMRGTMAYTWPLVSDGLGV
jgi:hypothetical protein